MPRYIENTPEAGCLMGSMRSMGYTFESAIADILDNSISAQSNEVHLFFPIDPTNCYVSILDDGCGMSNTELFHAMRYGSSACEDKRKNSDLGRFGLGMKSASLSQCRVLTVVSKQKELISAYRWDYNHIQGQSKWLLAELLPEDINDIPHINALKEQKQGTLVVWQDFDLLNKSTNGLVFTALTNYKEKLINYIGLIFHRFISARSKEQKVVIFINKHKIEALDPFLENHPKTSKRKEIDLAVEDTGGVERHIMAYPFVLPFIKDLSEEDLSRIGGAENMRIKQGFYIYRNKRLIIWGTWYGMQRTELTKNARILVDIPNTLDDIWSIDIKKQHATIPAVIQKQLKRAVEDAMSISIRQQTYRGRKSNLNDKINYVWNRMKGRDENHFFYSINRETELFKFVKSKLSDEEISYVDMLLDEIEKKIPIQQMYLDTANNNIELEYDSERENDIIQKASILVDNYIALNLEAKDIIDNMILVDESFYDIPNIKEILYKKYNLL